MAEFSDLIQKTIVRLSQVPGVGTQLFAEDRIAESLLDTFEFVWKEAWWPTYMLWITATLDGITGVATVDLGGDTPDNPIKEFADVRGVWKAGRRRPLIRFPSTTSPFELGTGTSPIYVDPLFSDDDKVFRILPITATGDIHINARIHPGTIVAATDIRIDNTLLINGAAWDYLEDDGSNPSSAEKFQSKFEARLKQLKKDFANLPLQLGPTAGEEIPQDWFSIA